MEVTVEEISAQTPNALSTGPFGSAISSRFFQDQGIPVIRGGNLSEQTGIRLNHENLVYVSEDKANEFTRSLVKRGDLVFTCWGTVNQVGLIDNTALYDQYIVSNKQMKFTPNPDRADSEFLYYLFSGPEMQATIKGQAIGSSVPGFNLGQLRSMKIQLPPREEQRAIADILGSLDDKIELNRRMNETLEATARAIFKSWFVDFDPVHYKARGEYPPSLDAETAALFPDSFEDSALGPIPSGWRAVLLQDYVNLIKGRSYKSEELEPSSTALVTLKSFERGGGYNPEGLKSYTGPYKPEQVVMPGEIVVAYTDITQQAEVIGRPAIVLDDPRFETLVASLDTAIVRPLLPLNIPYLYLLFMTDDFNYHAVSYTNGSTVLHLSKNALPEYEFVLPESRVLEVFDELTQPLFEKMVVNEQQIRTLAETRDALLPKLVSGEIRVGELQP
ncbi:MAG: restriction endonuclease subunit S [Anaerolineae bacterium]|nr:restriction endonuclease subunit S [Anaerolineae bacterium]